MVIRNYAEACEVQAIIRAKKDEAESLERQIRSINSRRASFTDSQLGKAVRDIAGMAQRQRELDKYVAEAKAAVNVYFAPATYTA